MKKDIRDYLHLYLGQEILYKDQHIKLLGVKNFTPWSAQCSVCVGQDKNNSIWTYDYEVKIMLRPLSDMRDEERQEAQKLMPAYFKLSFPAWDRFHYVECDEDGRETCGVNSHKDNLPLAVIPFLLKQGFDLFGLIQEGTAIDKTK